MNSEAQKQHFSLDELLAKNGKAKKHKSDEDGVDKNGFKLNPKDERFGAIYSNHEFNIDPSDKMYKPTKGMEELLKEKISKKFNKTMDGSNVSAKNGDESAAANASNDGFDASNLIKSIKNNTKNFSKFAANKPVK